VLVYRNLFFKQSFFTEKIKVWIFRVKVGSSSLLVKIYYFVLIRKIVRIKNRLILTGIFIELGVIEIEYELNKINVFTKIDEEPTLTRNIHVFKT
jgi:hypothetical protein